MKAYPIITLCGSTKFKEEFKKVEADLTASGWIVLTCGLFNHADGLSISETTKNMLDDMHKRKIAMSEAIFVINPGGYIGKSTASEIDLAQKMKLRIMYLEALEYGA